MYKTNKNKFFSMDNSLKLSYEMLFENGTILDQAEPDEMQGSELLTNEEMQQRLEEQEQQWIKRMEQARVEAESHGYEKGLEEGKKLMEDSFEKQLSSVKGMLQAVERQFYEVIEELKPHMADLVFEMAEKVLGVSYLHPEIDERVNDEVLKLVRELNEQLHIKVTVAKENYEMIQKALEKNENMDHFTLRVDDSYNPGEYAIETKKEMIIKNFKKMIVDFKESINFSEVDVLNLDA